jgi:N-sulfoglucosamine sulfohydrolase
MRALLFVFAILAAPIFSSSVAAAAERPNILFCIADDASFPYMGAYGCKWTRTPGFDRVAREGLLFTRAYTPNAKCAPSRACILTGRNSWQLEEAANHWCYFPPKFKVFTEVLAENGYVVGKTGKGWGPGVAKTADGAPRDMTGKPFDKLKAPPPASGVSNNDYAANFAAFLDARAAHAREKEQPFLFWYGGYEPHRGYEFASSLKAGRKVEEIDAVPPFWPDTEKVRTDMLDYALELEHFDTHLLRMIELLEKRGELDNTLIVVTADNGMPFPRVKGQEYEMSNHLPFACMWKKGIRAPGRTVDDYISFIDLAPTFLELAGVAWDAGGMQPSPGKSLTDIFASEKSGRVNPARDHVLIGKERHDIGRPDDVGYPIRGILSDGWLYLHNYEPSRWPACDPLTGYLNCDGSPTKTLVLEGRGSPGDRFWQLCFGKRPAEEFFNAAADPACMNNVATDTQFAERMQAMKERMERELKEQEDPRMFGRGEVFDKYPYAEKRSLDFYNRYKAGEKMNPGWVNATDFDTRED